MLSDQEKDRLTKIYNSANNVTRKSTPLATDSAFKAMLAIESAARAQALEDAAEYIESLDAQFWFEAQQKDCADGIRAMKGNGA